MKRSLLMLESKAFMATREEIAFIRDARAGNVSAQLALGKRYLFGGAGLKKI